MFAKERKDRLLIVCLNCDVSLEKVSYFQPVNIYPRLHSNSLDFSAPISQGYINLKIGYAMKSLPPSSRNTLQHATFTKTGNGYELSLPSYYMDVFNTLHPQIVQKMVPKPSGLIVSPLVTALLPTPENHEITTIERFIKIFSRVVIINKNKHISPHFSNELNSCTALEFNYDFEKKARTYYGNRLWQAKYQNNIQAKQDLTTGLSIILKELPYFPLQNCIVTYVPPCFTKAQYLPRDLVNGILTTIGTNNSVTLHKLDSWITIEKPEVKKLSIDQKFGVWNELYNGQVAYNCTTKEKLPVVIIEDSYQSGTTMWAYATYLKDLGFPEVHGLCCVKNMRDTDNK